eukprot:1535058-Pleurochrysis_carterae.AAC.1
MMINHVFASEWSLKITVHQQTVCKSRCQMVRVRHKMCRVYRASAAALSAECGYGTALGVPDNARSLHPE